MRRASAAALAALMTACSLTNLDGFATPPADAGTPSSGDSAAPPADATTVPTADAEADAGPAPDPYGEAVRADAPTAWFRFEDLPGSTFAKEETGTYPGSLDANPANPVTFGVPGAVGKAAKFAANETGITLGDVFDFDGKNEYAIEVWGENDAQEVEYESLLAKRMEDDQGPQNGWVFFREKSEQIVSFQFWKNGSSNVYAGTSKLTAGFHHYVVTSTRNGDAYDIVMYLDGELMPGGTKGSTKLQPSSPAPLRIGHGWHGRIDEVALYERSLPAARVRAHFQAAPR